MGARARPSRWLLVVAVVAISATAVALTAAIAGGSERPLLVAAAVGFLLSLLFGGIWASACGRSDPTAERAATAEAIASELRGGLLSLRALSATGLRGAETMTPEDRSAFFTVVDEEAARLRRTVDQLATALRVEASGLVYDLVEEDVGALVEESMSDVPHAEHPLRVTSEPGLRALVDRLRFGEILTALVDNAARFSPPDAPIEIRTYRGEDGDVVIEVADHGPGIPAGARVEVFRRATTWRPAGYEETPGAGVGLFVARAHVLGHGGQIEIDDRPEEDGREEPGAVLRIALPAST